MSNISFKMFSIAPTQVLIDMFTNDANARTKEDIQRVVDNLKIENNGVSNHNTFKYQMNNLIFVQALVGSCDLLVIFVDENNDMNHVRNLYHFDDNGIMQVQPIEVISRTNTQPSTQGEEDMEDKIGPIPNIDEKKETPTTEEPITLSNATPTETVHKLGDFTQQKYLYMLFKKYSPNYLDVLHLIEDEDKEYNYGYKVTGTLPVEVFIDFDDFTFSVVNKDNGKWFEIYVSITTDDKKHWIEDTDIKKWMLIANINRSACIIDNPNFQIPQRMF